MYGKRTLIKRSVQGTRNKVRPPPRHQSTTSPLHSSQAILRACEVARNGLRSIFILDPVRSRIESSVSLHTTCALQTTTATRTHDTRPHPGGNILCSCLSVRPKRRSTPLEHTMRNIVWPAVWGACFVAGVLLGCSTISPVASAREKLPRVNNLRGTTNATKKVRLTYQR